VPRVEFGSFEATFFLKFNLGESEASFHPRGRNVTSGGEEWMNKNSFIESLQIDRTAKGK
jgi:hypothetical protein